MSISVFLSTVSDEFLAYREQLKGDLTRHNVAVKVQEDFKDLGGDTLDKLDTYIAHCDAVVHLVGDMCGAAADERQQQALLAKHSDLPKKLPPLNEALENGLCLPYTQWEAWLALYHCKRLVIAEAGPNAPRGRQYAPTPASRAAQAEHLAWLRTLHRYPSGQFASPDELANQIAYSAILDLLVVDELVRLGVVQRAENAGIETSVVVSMAARLKPTQKLDFAQAVVEVSHAVDIAIKVAKEASSGSSDQLVDEALKRIAEKTKANDPVGATREAEEGFARWKKQEAERRAGALGSGIVLLEAALNTDLLRFDAAAAAARVEKIASLQQDEHPKVLFEAVRAQWKKFQVEGRNDGLNFSLAVAIAIAQRGLGLAHGPDQHGMALNDLGIALAELGERESGTEKLEQAVDAYHAALKERTRDRVPLDWAMTQTNLGNALVWLGERESGTPRLEEAVKAYRAALEEYTRERAPLDWATTQNNLGAAFAALGRRQSGPQKFEEAAKAFRAALEERTRERVPLDWAATQNNLGTALQALGELEGETAQLEEAIVAYHAALEEWTRDRVPLLWATAQGNVGNALAGLGKREGRLDKLEQAVAAYGAALEEMTRERVPLAWAATFSNQAHAMMLIAVRTNDGALSEIAFQQIQTALATLRDGGHAQRAAELEALLPEAQAIRDRLKGK
jgi:tetratricopeptide (TPR) repeat protein